MSSRYPFVGGEAAARDDVARVVVAQRRRALVRHDGDKQTSLWHIDQVGRTPAVTRKWASTTWSAPLAKHVVSDVDGDGRDDLVSLYKYGEREIKVWVHRSTADGVDGPRQAYGSAKWNWTATAVSR